MLKSLIKTRNFSSFCIRNSASSEVPINFVNKFGEIKDYILKLQFYLLKNLKISILNFKV